MKLKCKEQYIEDGFVKLKSLKRCIKEGLVAKNPFNNLSYLGISDFCVLIGHSDFYFTNVANNPGLLNEMIPYFGTVVNINTFQRFGGEPLITLEKCFNWPLEIIEK